MYVYIDVFDSGNNRSFVSISKLHLLRTLIVKYKISPIVVLEKEKKKII